MYLDEEECYKVILPVVYCAGQGDVHVWFVGESVEIFYNENVDLFLSK